MNSVETSPAVTGRLLGAVGIISTAMTAQEVVLLQILGWTHWHHFAYLVVAVAMLGFGTAGTVLTLCRDWLFRHRDSAAFWLLLAAAVAMPLGVRLAQSRALAVDIPLLFFAPANAGRLVALCALLLPPFFAGGLYTGLLLSYHSNTPGRLYAASLAGAGLGGLVGLALVAHVDPPRLAPAVGVLAMSAAALSWPERSRPQRVALALSASFVVGSVLQPGTLAASQFKPLRRTLDLPGAQTIAERTGLRGWVQVVAAPALRPSPALSFSYTGAVPPHPAIFVNGLAAGSLPDVSILSEADWLDYTTDAVAFKLAGRGRRVLLLENGPGGWTALALRHGARTVTVVEPNHALVGLVTSGPRPLAPEWRLPGVTVATVEPREFLRRGPNEFDLIRLPTVGSFGGSSGLGAAGEQFLFTHEGIQNAWSRLSPTGAIAVTAWMDFPERNPLRLLATLAEMLAESGASVRSHLLAVRGWASVTFVVGRRPWSAADIAAVREACDEKGFDLLLAPGVTAEERQRNHTWQNPAFFDIVDRLVDGPREPVYAGYAFDLRPTTDRHPYFSQFVRPSQLVHLRETFGSRAVPFFELGSAAVALAFAMLALLAAVCIALPLVRLPARERGRSRVVLYFGGLGAGYMLVEIGAMLAAQAWLGSAIAAAATVITSLLLASGIGSVVSERLAATRRTITGVLIGALIGIAVAAAALLTGAGQMLPFSVRIGIVALIAALPGIAMGMAFPLGLRRISSATPALVPWAWAVNGCLSVVTPAGATLLAMSRGFNAVYIAAACAYGIALLAIATRASRQQRWQPKV